MKIKKKSYLAILLLTLMPMSPVLAQSLNQTLSELRINPSVTETTTPDTNEEVQNVNQRVMAGELGGYEFNKYEIRKRLAALVPEYEPSESQDEPVILRIKTEALA